MMKRRQFLSQCSALSLVAAIAHRLPASSPSRRPRVLLRSSWQCVNIGDIAHTPGVLALLEEHLPDVEVTLWASGNLTEEVAAMEHARFPKLKIVKGTINDTGRASNDDLQAAIATTDFLLHGSGPSLVAARDVAAFTRHTGKPFGVYGITHGSYRSGGADHLLSDAEFVFFRDSVSLELAKEEGVNCPVMEFGPDGAFACDLRADEKAEKFLAANGLEPGNFLCCLSRLRYTPYWTIPGDHRKANPDRVARNEAMREHDHAPIREAIIRVIRETDRKVLLCPEDMTQMTVGKENLYNKLPADVQRRVVWRKNFWLTDEALSVYVRSAGLFGSEMHSPIMAVGNGIPAIVCRFAEQTSKGFMWRDIGLDEWLFDLDIESEAAAIPDAVLAMASDFAAAQAKTEKAKAFVQKRQRETMQVLQQSLSDGEREIE
ncbi:polysaccharide pyruvyl transferase family protein [Allorhodopirellula solitaria]|uniref:Polysaccharide pyruvyl transferase n=1 Tax=Allorhodopirellula solitaria TaxID=2527987 RepID=A0A5C5YHH0_9BACT|nr:polysaccharide pyruvyl transferase family protein [Allorhodopirellula solitaria]TWT74135.1 Polysaccharide pyruvyl transferase [Allorhodopirellula solitaria]